MANTSSEQSVKHSVQDPAPSAPSEPSAHNKEMTAGKAKKNMGAVIDVHLSSVYKIRNNAIKMLANRSEAYLRQIKEHYADITLDKFEKMYSKASNPGELSIHVYLYIKKEGPKDGPKELLEQCIVYFLESFIKLDKATFLRSFKTVYQTFDKSAKVVRLIIVAPDASKGRTKSNIEKHLATKRDELNKENKEQKLITEFFTHSMLSFDLVAHSFVPKHVLIKSGSAEEAHILKEFQKEKLPKISETDAVSRYYAAEVGDIFMIFRESPTSGFNIGYRVVIAD